MPSLIRSTFALVVLAALVPVRPAAAQRDDAEWLDDCRSNYNRGGYQREHFCEVRETRLRAPSGTISMEGLRNGGISVTGWDRDSLVVRTRLRTQARSSARAREIASQVRTLVRGSVITAEGPSYDGDDESWSALLVVTLPRRSDIRVETRNGPVSVEEVRGNMNVETRNGPLALRDLAGSVKARTTNGPLSLSVPDGYSARLEAGTTNGPVSVGFPITVVGRINRNISTDLGSGGATIRAFTTNGPLTVRRR